MATWASKIEEFAKPAHKNIAIFIPNITPEEIESVFDSIADDNHWTLVNSLKGGQILN